MYVEFVHWIVLIDLYILAFFLFYRINKKMKTRMPLEELVHKLMVTDPAYPPRHCDLTGQNKLN